MPELGLELLILSAQSSAALAGYQDVGEKKNIVSVSNTPN